MRVSDELLQVDMLHDIRNFVLDNCKFGWKSTKHSNQSVFHINFVLDKKDTNYITDSYSNLTWDYFIKTYGNSHICELSKYISKEFFNGNKLTRVYANVQFTAQETDIHRDYDIKFFDTAKTVVLYLSDLEAHQGGSTIILNEDKEILHCVRPSFGRLVEFNGCMLHGVTPMSKYYNEPRIALVFGLENCNE
jgi:hypothetical protein